eukprot:6229288-Prymnesium_polylepis.1
MVQLQLVPQLLLPHVPRLLARGHLREHVAVALGDLRRQPVLAHRHVRLEGVLAVSLPPYRIGQRRHLLAVLR